MKIYIASRDQMAARHLRELLGGRGHAVTARWLDHPGYTGMPASDAEKVAAAVENLGDIREADLLLLRSEPDGSFVPGGKHVETGVALALGKRVIVLGCPENLFHWHPLVTVVDCEEALLELLDCIQRQTNERATSVE